MKDSAFLELTFCERRQMRWRKSASVLRGQTEGRGDGGMLKGTGAGKCSVLQKNRDAGGAEREEWEQGDGV